MKEYLILHYGFEMPAAEEMAARSEFDHVVVNEQIDSTAAELDRMIR